MRVELTNERVLTIVGLSEVLLSPTTGALGRKFGYAIARNQSKLQRYADSFQKGLKKDEGYQAYDSARVELAKEMAMKDPEGEPILKDGKYVQKNQGLFEERLTELRRSEEHKEAWDSYEEAMKEKVKDDDGKDPNLYAIKLSWIPDNHAFTGQINKVMVDFIEDDSEEIEKKEKEKSSKKDG